LRRWTGLSHRVPGNRGLRNLDAELKHLAVNASRSPERVEPFKSNTSGNLADATR
jgi:hypothetical protein